MILLFTNKTDVHPTPVIAKIAESGGQVFRINTEDLITDYIFSWWTKDGKSDFWIKCLSNDLECKGSQVTAIWDRRPEKPSSLPINNTSHINEHILSETLEFLRFLRHYLRDIPSIGSILMDRSASSKMLQNLYATECGMIVPDTCYSNRKELILDNLTNNQSLCIKGISGDFVYDDAKMQEYLFWTKKIERADLENAPEDAFLQTVSFIQEYVPKDFELRVTVVGNEFFPCRIDSQALTEDKGAVDWRQGYLFGLKYSVYDLPDAIKRHCLEFLQKMKISFGCFDFVVTPKGDYVFLECNPNGQWLWVEEETGLNISGAIAKWLLKQ